MKSWLPYALITLATGAVFGFWQWLAPTHSLFEPVPQFPRVQVPTTNPAPTQTPTARRPPTAIEIVRQLRQQLHSSEMSKFDATTLMDHVENCVGSTHQDAASSVNEQSICVATARELAIKFPLLQKRADAVTAKAHPEAVHAAAKL